MGDESWFAKKWLEKAITDFAYAKHSLEFGSLDWAQLAAQQAAEKALKAVCIEKGVGLIKTHDLQLLARKVNAPKEIIGQSSLLNSFYTISRYPDLGTDLDEKTLKEATEDAIIAAEKVVGWCRKQTKT
ncbi:MAG TPA: HEPN domain-containing protein [archaeon]|nr:HEPN domain-containing protein [archaeon]